MLVPISRMYNVLFGLLFATVREIGGYGDTLPIPLSVVGFDPFFAALDAAGEGGNAIQEGADPSGRLIVSAPRSAAVAWVAAGVEEVD